MQLSKYTSTGTRKNFLINMILISIIIIVVVILGKIDFPSPNKEIQKIIPNEKLKIIK